MIATLWQRLPTEPRYTMPPLLVALLLVLIFVLPESLLFQLTYERSLILEGQWWRIISGQWVHLSWSHLLMNLLGILLMWFLFAEHAVGWRYVPVVIWIGAGANLGMLVTSPEIGYYVGFSGVLYGMFAWGACHDIDRKVRFGVGMLLGMSLLVTWDYFWGTPTSALDLAVAAHFYGVIAGVLLAAAQIGWRRFNQTARSPDSSTPNS
ncbi:MAG: rhombosortase [Idiomarina sp.]|nr:rhombosortase [Idiomarina sp.]